MLCPRMFLDYPPANPQPPPPQPIALHAPISLAGHAGLELATWATGRLSLRVKRFLPHLGQAGFWSPRIKTSNSLEQVSHVYS